MHAHAPRVRSGHRSHCGPTLEACSGCTLSRTPQHKALSSTDRYSSTAAFGLVESCAAPPGAGGRFPVRMCGLQRARSQGAAAPICRVLLTACVQRSTRHLACTRWRRDAHVGRPPAVAPAVSLMGCLLPVARLCATAGCGLCGRRARSSSQPTGRPSVPFAALPRFNPNAASRAACSVPDAAACKRSQLVLSVRTDAASLARRRGLQRLAAP